jgi:hypothetical protein
MSAWDKVKNVLISLKITKVLNSIQLFCSKYYMKQGWPASAPFMTTGLLLDLDVILVACGRAHIVYETFIVYWGQEAGHAW